MAETYGDSDIVSKLKDVREALARMGVAELRVFGSVARGTTMPDSDVDVLVRFSGRSTFDRYMDLKSYLERLLDRPVDLVTERALRPELREAIEQEAIRVA